MPNTSDLKNRGLKVTAPRMKILKLFEDNADKHLSAEDIVHIFNQAGDDSSLATVYRVLNQFEAAGILLRHRFEDDHNVFELNTGKHHDHIVCVRCQAVAEFCDPTIEALQAQIAAKQGFELTNHALTLYGVCENCRA